jgi:diguanylate cyclase (GGDEF)-like protein
MTDPWLLFGAVAVVAAGGAVALARRSRSPKIQAPASLPRPERRQTSVANPASVADLAREADALTGLLSRSAFEHGALAELARRRHRGEWSGLLRVEIDGIAEINETYGHAAGDELLKQAAGRLTDALGGGAMIGRLGGAGFVALTEGGDRGAGARAATRLVEAMSARFTIEGIDAPCSATAGLALAPADGEDLAQLMRRAELARLRARHEGGGAWKRYEAALDHMAQARRELLSALGEARGQGQLALYYQPIVEVATGRVRGFEALLRWRHPTLGLVGAQEFVPLAEEAGLIGSIGQWALEEACREAAGWPDDLRVAVNVSPLQLRAGGLPGEVAKALRASGLRPQRLEIEVTEGVLIGDRDFARHELDRIRELGVGLSLDDFGAGFASFGYLCSFPFSKLKIDQSFLREMTNRPSNAVVIKSIVGLAADLGLSLVVEGVDSPEQKDWLIANGCAEAQGYLFGRPMPAEEVSHRIAERAAAA